MYNDTMKWLILVSIVTCVVTYWVMKLKSNINLFLENYEIAIIDKEDVERTGTQTKDILDLRPESYDNSIDLRGTPTHLCPCGSNIWNLKVIFEDFEIATYFLDMECVSCGSVATAPTPVDRMGTEE
jgi:hypothetical protein